MAKQRTECRNCCPERFVDDGKGILIGELKRKYSMTADDYYFLRFEFQDNICPICDKELVSGDIHVDHLHGTDIIRGLLHSNCNASILATYECMRRSDNPVFNAYIDRNPLQRQAINDPPLVRRSGSVSSASAFVEHIR